MARLTSVTVRRFKRIEDLTVDLDDVTLLIGANNSGKSSILQAIHFAVSIAQTAKLVGEGVSWRSDAFELSYNPSQLLYSPVGDVLSLATGGALQEPRQSQIEIEFADGQLRCVVATEDTQTDGLRALLWSNGFVEDDTSVASYAGCTKADAAMVLGRFLTDKAPHIRLAVHRDRDYMSDAEATRFKTRLDADNIALLLTAHSDIESYFISADHLHALNPGVSAARIQQLIDQATQDTANQSVEAIVNLRTQEAFKLRQAGVGPPNHGAIAVEAQSDYAADPPISCASFGIGPRCIYPWPTIDGRSLGLGLVDSFTTGQIPADANDRHVFHPIVLTILYDALAG